MVPSNLFLCVTHLRQSFTHNTLIEVIPTYQPTSMVGNSIVLVHSGNTKGKLEQIFFDKHNYYYMRQNEVQCEL